MNIRLNLSEAFVNKDNLMGQKSAFGFSFFPYECDLPTLVKHIRSGKAFTVGLFSDNRRIESHFVSSQLLALDLDQCPMDIDQLEEWSVFLQEYAFFMYPTPSSTLEQPKTRILFVLDRPVESSTRWRVLQLGLMEYFNQVKPDAACKDPSRLFYGSKTTQYYVNYEAVLQISVVANFAIPQAEHDEFMSLEAQYTVRIQRGESDLERCAYNFLNHGLRQVAGAAQGEKHNTFRNYALWLYGLVAGGWPISKSDVEQGLRSIATSWGDSDSTINNNLRWPEANCTPIKPEDVKLSDRGHHVQAMKRQERYQS